MCPRSSVVDVTKDMELVDGQALDDITDGTDKVVGTTGRDNRIDNHTDVSSLVVIRETLVKQFLNDI